MKKWRPIGNYYFLRGRLDRYDDESNEELSISALMKAQEAQREKTECDTEDCSRSDETEDVAYCEDEATSEFEDDAGDDAGLFNWEEMLEELPEPEALERMEEEDEAAALAQAGFSRPDKPHAYVVSDNINELLDMPLSAGQLVRSSFSLAKQQLLTLMQKKSLPDHFMPKYEAHVCYIFGGATE